MHTNIDISSSVAGDRRQTDRILSTMKRKSFAVVSSVSASGHGHAAGVVYDLVDQTLFAHTMRHSRKARNIEHNAAVGVVIPVPKLPVGPPFTIQFQGTATLLAMDDPEVRDLLGDARLSRTSGHGALEEPDGCFVKIVPTGRVHSYGIGVPILQLMKDPLHSGARFVDLG